MPEKMPPPTLPHLSPLDANKYLVSYDILGEPSAQRYERLDSVLKSKYRGTEILRSDWIIESTESAQSIFDTLKRLMLPTDRLVVLRVADTPIVANPKS